MLETHPLQRVVQLDVHAQVVGVQLEFVAWQDAAIFLNIQRQGGNFTVHTQAPVAVLAGVGLVINFEIGHAGSPAQALHHPAEFMPVNAIYCRYLDLI